MSLNLRALAHKSWRTIASIQTGVVLLILVVILVGGRNHCASAARYRGRRDAERLLPACAPDSGCGGIDRRISRLVVPRIAVAGQPLHRSGFRRSFPQFVALLLASLQISRRKLPPRFPSTEIAGHCGRRIGVGGGGARTAFAGIQTRAGGARRPLWNFRGTAPDLRACGVHRPCQPAAHFLWHAGGRSLGLAWISQSE